MTTTTTTTMRTTITGKLHRDTRNFHSPNRVNQISSQKTCVCVWWISIKFIHNKCVDIELTFWIWWIYEANNNQIFSRVTWWWWFRKSTLCQCYNQQDTLIHWLTGWRNEWMNVAGSNLTLFRFDSCCLLETKT